MCVCRGVGEEGGIKRVRDWKEKREDRRLCEISRQARSQIASPHIQKHVTSKKEGKES